MTKFEKEAQEEFIESLRTNVKDARDLLEEYESYLENLHLSTSELALAKEDVGEIVGIATDLYETLKDYEAKCFICRGELDNNYPSDDSGERYCKVCSDEMKAQSREEYETRESALKE